MPSPIAYDVSLGTGESFEVEPYYPESTREPANGSEAIMQAETVAAAMRLSNTSEDSGIKSSSRKKNLLGILLLCSLMIIGVGIYVGLQSSKKPGQGQTFSTNVEDVAGTNADNETGDDENEPQERDPLLDVIIEGLGDTITEEVLVSEETLENRAFVWLKDNMPEEFEENQGTVTGTSMVDVVDMVQRYILILFYFSLNGNGWTRYSPLNATHECNWGFLSCWEYPEKESDQVWRISIDKANVTGSLHPSIGKLPYLERISLEDNQIKGSLPEILGTMPSLNRIDVDGNQLTGKIPESIYNNSKMEVIDADDNNFTGTIPGSIGNAKQLIHFSMKKNNISGTIPATFGELKKLKNLVISENDITGSVPNSICNLLNQINGSLQDLWADCLESNEEVKCSCCTQCGQVEG
uniref:L domain-like protein n=1 Tax=Corethron hystrix TaxID=216773 RepID=A0A7S1FSZ6_9STRA|mmetsp:Transcript_26316/g.60615  ORF Transcript_26316/g.60615 Transcript_26316/m.60615 type:complete len:410 (+) Transcript_26316:107-1336(+)